MVDLRSACNEANMLLTKLWGMMDCHGNHAFHIKQMCLFLVRFFVVFTLYVVLLNKMAFIKNCP